MFSNLTVVTTLVAGQVVLVVFLIVTALKVADSLTLKVAGMDGKSV